MGRAKEKNPSQLPNGMGFGFLKYGGGEENRTPVRKSDYQAFSERSLCFNIPSLKRPQTGLGAQ